MSRGSARIGLVLAAGLLVQACVSARIQVVDERTALENQILGSYEELDRDLQLVASVRALDGEGRRRKQPRFSEIRARAVAARQVQQFQRDDVEELKTSGCLGESLDNRLVARPCERAGRAEVSARIARLIEAENEARAVLLDFVIATSPDLTDADRARLSRTWARLNREQARTGWWIEVEAGRWVQK